MKIITYNKRFEFCVIGYEFESSEEYYDANWLKVRIVAMDDDHEWSAEDSCILTHELVEFHQKMIGVIKNPEKNMYVEFTEGELKFGYNGETNVFTVFLDFHFHPKGEGYVYGDGGDSFYELSFSLSDNAKESIVDSLSVMCKKYPVRGVLP